MKHGPGVMCLIRSLGECTMHPDNVGKTVTILSAAPDLHLDGVTYKCWQCECPSGLTVVHGPIFDLTGIIITQVHNETAIPESFLIPIAGPGLDTENEDERERTEVFQ